MKKSYLLRVCVISFFVLLMTIPCFSFSLGGKEMVKNGTGSRTKAFLTIYYATLYVPQEMKGAAAKDIIEAKAPMSIIMTIDSRLVDKDKFVSSVTDSFKKAASAGYATSDSQKYLNLFNNVKIVKGDRFYQNYVPGKGLTVRYKSKATGQTTTLGTIKGLSIKKAFFGMFLSSKPIQ